MPKSPPRYPDAFREEAVELVHASGTSIPQIARDLGSNDQTLRTWVKQAAIDAGHGPPGELTTAEREELRRLRREHQVLRQEREILNEVTAFFVKETS